MNLDWMKIFEYEEVNKQIIKPKKRCRMCNLETKDNKLTCDSCKHKCKLKTKISSYKYGATSRGFEWNLTDQVAILLFKTERCFYCGEKNYDKKGNVQDWMGIDRVDSSKGYSFDNVVSCCSVCNRMKSDQNKQQFINKCIMITMNDKLKVQKNNENNSGVLLPKQKCQAVSVTVS